MSIHRRQDTGSGPVVPAVCFAFCNNAYKEALSSGMTPEICEDGSQFRVELKVCQDCIFDNLDDPKSEAGRTYVDETFGQYQTYCEGQAPLPVAVVRIQTFTLPNGAVTVIEYLDVAGLEEATSTAVSINSTLSSPTGTAASAGETSSALPPPSSSPEPELEQGSSKAWIAGAVVGPLVLLSLIITLVWWLRRRRLQQSASPPTDAVPSSPTMEKAQLHSDSISPYKYAVEVDSGQVHELDASIRPAEFPANETPAHELPDKAHKGEL